MVGQQQQHLKGLGLLNPMVSQQHLKGLGLMKNKNKLKLVRCRQTLQLRSEQLRKACLVCLQKQASSLMMCAPARAAAVANAKGVSIKTYEIEAGSVGLSAWDWPCQQICPSCFFFF